MFEAFRRFLASRAGERTAFDPPTVLEPDAMRRARDGLAGWLRSDPERFDAFFLRAEPARFTFADEDRRISGVLAQAGLSRTHGDTDLHRPQVRVFELDGKLIATDLLSHRSEDQVFSLMFEQVYLVRHMDVRPKDRVLELCLGSGVNSLFAAERAAAVDGVDINPRALAFARFNMALNDQRGAITLHQGSLFEPFAAERRFDVILVNPPFELVPPGGSHFLHSHGGADGLDVIRAILEEAPCRLHADGRFEIITYSPGDETKRVRLLDLLREAFPKAHIDVHLLGIEPIATHLEPFASHRNYDAWSRELEQRGDTHVHFVFARVDTGRPRGLDVTHPAEAIAASHAVADVWA